ncbi:MAG: SPOR domain-containing protein [Rhodobacteraceae bacterium]|nr:SPOR domain-containing protein [Paracoccaceae bacterium]
MADIKYTYDVYAPNGAPRDVVQGVQGVSSNTQPTPTGFGNAVRMLGAVASLALVAGVGIWGYKLIARDVSGVPVVRALAGPMRIQPVDPGGFQADHQGLAVNAVAADGTAAATADRLMLAPPPVELALEDVPIGQSVAVAEVAQEPAVDSDPQVEKLASLTVDALVAQLTGQKPGVGELSNPGAVADDQANVQPYVQPEVLMQDATTDAETTQPEVQAAGVPGPGVTRSLRPQVRPARLLASGGAAEVLTAALDGAVDTSAQVEIDPNSLPIGTRLAQLGAYDGADVARGEWDKLTIKFSLFFEGKQRVIQKASSGGRTFYRLRAMGFDDLSAARRFCSALVSENADCIPVTTR